MKQTPSVTRLLMMASVAGPVLALASAAEAADQHVIILSIDGLHAADLTDPATAQYLPNILGLESTGVNYTNARTTSPSDSFPGTLALVTGATTKSTGVYYDDSYSRTLYAPGTTAAQISSGAVKPGTEVQLFENLDKNQTLLSGGGPTSGPGAYGKGALDRTQLPVNSSGNVVYPWQYNHTNTIFDIATAAGKTSYFSDKHPAAYNIVQGPTGKAVTDFYSPEINSNTAIIGGKLVDSSTAPAGTPTGDATNQLGVTTNNYQKTQAWDDLKKTALLNVIDGKNALGDMAQATPSIMYSNFQSVSVAQKLLTNSTGTGGIDVVNGTEVVNPALQSALQHDDAIVGSLVSELKAKGEYSDTQIILTAKHGQDPRLNAATLIKDSAIPNALTAAGIATGQVTQDDVSLIWLKNESDYTKALAALQAYAASSPYQEVLAIHPGAQFGSPATANQTPDFIVQLKPGFIYVGNTANTRKRAEHGNVFNLDDTWVPLIVSGAGVSSNLDGTMISSLVNTTQVAPTVLADLGLNYNLLDGVRLEGTQFLPGLGLVAVPEPSTWAMLLTGFAGLGFVRGVRLRFRRRSVTPYSVS
jgi:hypothetical protein